jgi:hypothetical protein
VNRQGNDRLAASLRRETVMKELLHTHYRAAGGQPTFASWNQIAAWLRQLDRLGRFVGGGFQRMALMFGQKSSAGAAASLRGVSRKPHVVVCENRKNERL